MSFNNEATVIPHQLCQYCKKAAVHVLGTFEKSHEEDLLIEHYPNIQAFLDSLLQGQCHLCAAFSGGVVRRHGLEKANEALEKLGSYHDKADRALHSTAKPSGVSDDLDDPDNSDHLKLYFLSLGWEKDDGTLDPVTVVKLKQHTRDTVMKDVTPETLQAFTGSHQIFALIKRWLYNCSKDHLGCRDSLKRRMPTRLLDVGLENTGVVRLVSGSTIGQVPYAALSYCWGTIPQMLLLPENHSEFKSRIPFKSLSRVAQDAATVCRAMSVRYVWIDAMCIIQGPQGDFQQEAAHMEDVYANALFTIHAAASSGATHPFLVRRDPLWWTDCHLLEEESGEIRGYIEGEFCEAFDNKPGTFNLDYRGWCFQERFLSPRSIHFGDKGVHWECRATIVCERYQDMGVENHKDAIGPSFKRMYKKLVSLGDNVLDPETNLTLRRVWDAIVGRYSEAKLTYQSDKLVALAGVASIIESKFHVKASFGLWLELSLDQLMWYNSGFTVGSARRLNIAPSWSWANVDECLVGGVSNAGGEDTSRRLLKRVSATVISLPLVTGFAISLPSLEAGIETPIRLQGRLAACVCLDYFTGRLDPKDFPPESTQSNGIYHPDTDTEESDLYCFLLKKEYWMFLDPDTGKDLDRGEIENRCLVLAPVPGSRNRFRRTGTYVETLEASRCDANATGGCFLDAQTRMFAGEEIEQEIEII